MAPSSPLEQIGRGSTGPVVARAARVLATFSPTHQRQTLREIAARAGLPLSTTHRIVGDLLDWGALERDEHGKLHIGIRLRELGTLAPRGLDLRELARPVMEDLFAALDHDVHLAVRDGAESVCVERIVAPGSLRVPVKVGGRWALPPTGTGRVLLAHAPPQVRERVLAVPVHRYTSRTITDPERLRGVLADVRRKGYAVIDRELDEESISVAAPIRAAGQRVVAALSVIAPYDAVQADALAPAVRTAANGISRALRERLPLT